jgi:hypothetical protein
VVCRECYGSGPAARRGRSLQLASYGGRPCGRSKPHLHTLGQQPRCRLPARTVGDKPISCGERCTQRSRARYGRLNAEIAVSKQKRACCVKRCVREGRAASTGPTLAALLIRSTSRLVLFTLISVLTIGHFSVCSFMSKDTCAELKRLLIAQNFSPRCVVEYRSVG